MFLKIDSKVSGLIFDMGSKTPEVICYGIKGIKTKTKQETKDKPRQMVNANQTNNKNNGTDTQTYIHTQTNPTQSKEKTVWGTDLVSKETKNDINQLKQN